MAIRAGLYRLYHGGTGFFVFSRVVVIKDLFFSRTTDRELEFLSIAPVLYGIVQR